MAIPPLIAGAGVVAAGYGIKKLYDWHNEKKAREAAREEQIRQLSAKQQSAQITHSAPKPQRQISQQNQPKKQKGQNMGKSNSRQMQACINKMQERMEEMYDDFESEREAHREEMEGLRYEMESEREAHREEMEELLRKHYDEMYELREEMEDERRKHHEEINELHIKMIEMQAQHAQTIQQLQADFHQKLMDTVAQVRLSAQASANELSRARGEIESCERGLLAWADVVAADVDAKIAELFCESLAANSNLDAGGAEFAGGLGAGGAEFGGAIGRDFSRGDAVADAAAAAAQVREQMEEVLGGVVEGFAPHFERVKAAFRQRITAGLSLANAQLARILQGENGEAKAHEMAEFSRGLQAGALREFCGEVEAALEGVLAGARERFAGRLAAQKSAIVAREHSLAELANATNAEEKTALLCAAGLRLARWQAACEALSPLPSGE